MCKEEIFPRGRNFLLEVKIFLQEGIVSVGSYGYWVEWMTGGMAVSNQKHHGFNDEKKYWRERGWFVMPFPRSNNFLDIGCRTEC